MDRTADRSGPRSIDRRRFEVFVREEEAAPLSHVGTVTAQTPDAAHEEANKLFAWCARDLWVCPASETHRYSAEPLVERDRRADDATTTPRGDEPHVSEETGETRTVACGGDSPEADVGDPADTDTPEEYQ